MPIAPDPDPASPALALTSASHRRPTATAFPDAPDPPAMEAPCARGLTSSRTAPPLDAWNRTTPPPRSRWILAARSSTRLRLRRTASSSSPSPPTSLPQAPPRAAAIPFWLTVSPAPSSFPCAPASPPLARSPLSPASFPPATPGACLYALPRAGRAQRLTPLRPLRRALAPHRRGVTAVASGDRPRRNLLSPVPLWWPRACVPAPAPKTTMAPWGL
nr:proline-rich protein 36-like [Aegilops tauschii subsp. strangulata]